jgi:hypothetical protein
VGEAAAKAFDDIDVGLAERVRGARVVVARADLGQLGRGTHARFAQLHALERDWSLDIGDRQPQVPGGERRRLADRLLAGLLVLIAPAPVLEATFVHARESMLTL